MNIPLTKNMIMDLETGQVIQDRKRIGIEFFDPLDNMNKCILDDVSRYTFPQLAQLADFQRELGRTEIKIRRRG